MIYSGSRSNSSYAALNPGGGNVETPHDEDTDIHASAADALASSNLRMGEPGRFEGCPESKVFRVAVTPGKNHIDRDNARRWWVH